MVREQRVATGLGLLAVIYIAGAWNLPRFALQSAVVDAHVFPLAQGALLLMLSAIYYVRSSRPRAVSGPEQPLLAGVDRPILLKLWGGSLVYALTLSFLGYLIATSLFLAWSLRVLGVRKPVQLGAIALGFSVVTYSIFAYLLGVPLARGILPF